MHKQKIRSRAVNLTGRPFNEKALARAAETIGHGAMLAFAPTNPHKTSVRAVLYRQHGQRPLWQSSTTTERANPDSYSASECQRLVAHALNDMQGAGMSFDIDPLIGSG